VQAFATGMLSFLGHSPTFAVRDFAGTLAFAADTVESLNVQVTVRAGGLQLLDDVKPADRREIEATMHRDVLHTAAHPEIGFESASVTAQAVAGGHYRVRIDGRLALRGVTRPQPVDAELLVYDDGVRLRGGSLLRPSDYGIRPVTALGGTIRLKDEIKVAFDVAGLPEGS
jgi:polyisoprenoid-binding protein YceI